MSSLIQWQVIHECVLRWNSFWALDKDQTSSLLVVLFTQRWGSNQQSHDTQGRTLSIDCWDSHKEVELKIQYVLIPFIDECAVQKKNCLTISEILNWYDKHCSLLIYLYAWSITHGIQTFIELKSFENVTETKVEIKLVTLWWAMISSMCVLIKLLDLREVYSLFGIIIILGFACNWGLTHLEIMHLRKIIYGLEPVVLKSIRRLLTKFPNLFRKTGEMHYITVKNTLSHVDHNYFDVFTWISASIMAFCFRSSLKSETSSWVNLSSMKDIFNQFIYIIKYAEHILIVKWWENHCISTWFLPQTFFKMLKFTKTKVITLFMKTQVHILCFKVQLINKSCSWKSFQWSTWIKFINRMFWDNTLPCIAFQAFDHQSNDLPIQQKFIINQNI